MPVSADVAVYADEESFGDGGQLGAVLFQVLAGCWFIYRLSVDIKWSF